MSLIVKLGFRNLLRNKRRTFLASLAIGMGLASIIVADGFWKGMIENMIKSVTQTYIGHVQLHHPQFLETYESHFYLKNSDELIQKLQSNPDVAFYSKRALSVGMVSSAEDSLNVTVMGILPEEEKHTSLFFSRLIQGKYLTKDEDILIGDKLRKKLGISLGERLVVTVTNAKTGEIEQQLFRLAGVFGIGTKEMDEGFALIGYEKLKKMLGITGPQEIVFKFKKLDEVEKNKDFIESLNSSTVSAKSWNELVPQIVAAIEMSDTSIGIMAIVLFTLVGLGILNTMFMGLYERTYEFGVVRAIGTKNKQLVQMILMEAFALSLFSIVVGLLIAFFVGGYMAYYGVDYSGISFGEMTFTEKIYFVFDWKHVSSFPFGLMLFTVIISLYPALRILKIEPAKALHKSM